MSGMPKEERAVSGNFEVHCALTTQRTIKITGVIYNDDCPADISRRVDVAQDELDRQFVRGDIINKTAQIAAAEINLKRMREHCDGLIKKGKGGKLSSQEKVVLENADKTMKAEVDKIADLLMAVEAAKKKLVIV